MTVLYVLAGWCASSIILGTILCALISRGKMDSHRRDDRSGSGDPVGFRGGRQRGLNIDHGDML